MKEGPLRLSGRALLKNSLGEVWAREHDIPVKIFPAEWGQYGRSAGPRRNEKMAAYADALIALPTKDSRGTRHMIEVARRRGLKIYVYEVL